MTEFIKHVLPIFLRPLSPICLMPTIGDADADDDDDDDSDVVVVAVAFDNNNSSSLLLRSRSDDVVCVRLLFNDEVDEELPARAFLLIRGEVEMSYRIKHEKKLASIIINILINRKHFCKELCSLLFDNCNNEFSFFDFLLLIHFLYKLVFVL